MNFHEWLNTRITKEEWDAWWSVKDITQFSYVMPPRQFSFSSLANLKATAWHEWWTIRENFRYMYGIYTQSSVLERLNELYPGFYLHVSKTEHTAVAFTPDKAAGAADRQVPISLGRWLARYAPYLSDQVIKNLVAEHLAEVAAEVEFVDQADYKSVYTDVRASASYRACMSKEFNTDWHTTDVYKMPNIRLAVIRNADGVPLDRSFVREDTKEFIRCYPADSARLRNALTRMGYKPGSWAGIELNKVVLSEDDNYIRVAMPYLDQFDGRAQKSHCSVYYLDDKLMVATPEQVETWSTIIQMHFASSTSGEVLLQKHSSSDFIYVDELTGKHLSKLDPDFMLYKVLTSSGLKTTADKDYIRGLQTLMSVDVENSRTVYVLVEPGTQSFRFQGYDFADTSENRHALGYLWLSSTYYPDQKDWFFTRGHDAVMTEAGYVKREDAVRVVDAYGIVHFAHKAEVVGNSAYTKLHAAHRSSTDIYTLKENVTLTRTKRKVHRYYHEVERLWDGTWDFKKNLKAEWVASGCTIWIGRKDKLTPEMVYQYIKRKLEDSSLLAENSFAPIQSVAAWLLDSVNAWNELPTHLTYNNVMWARQAGKACTAVHEFKALGIDPEWALLEAAEQYAHDKPLLGCVRYAKEAYVLWKAEAEAVDYNTEKQPQKPEAVETANTYELELV